MSVEIGIIAILAITSLYLARRLRTVKEAQRKWRSVALYNVEQEQELRTANSALERRNKELAQLVVISKVEAQRKKDESFCDDSVNQLAERKGRNA